jgi:hypothetical protein
MKSFQKAWFQDSVHHFVSRRSQGFQGSDRVRQDRTQWQTGQIWALEPLLNDLNTSKKKLLQTLMTLLLLFSDTLLIVRVLSVPKWIWAFQRTVFSVSTFRLPTI